MGGKSSAPASPDYRAIVEQQGRESRETARFNHGLGQVNTSGPFGSTWWEGNTLKTGLNNQEAGNYAQQGWMGDQAAQYAPNAIHNAASQLNMGSLPGVRTNIDFATGDRARQQAIDAVYGQYTSKLDPMFQRQNTDLETSLINKGFDMNSAAAREQLANQSRNQADAYQQALNSAVTQGNETQNQNFMQQLQAGSFNNSARQQLFDEMLRGKSAAWGDVQNILGMNQMQMPQGMQGAMGNAQAPDYMNAAQNQYQAALNQTNVGNANNANMWSTIGSLGGMAAMFFSDARLKDNFEEVGQTTEGVPVWEYDIDGRRERGVIAQQVQQLKPEAVKQHESGFLMVDYSQVGKF